jgi:hypothetical protein
MGRSCTHSLALLGLATTRIAGVGRSLPHCRETKGGSWVGNVEGTNKHSRRCEIRRTKHHDHHHDHHHSSHPSKLIPRPPRQAPGRRSCHCIRLRSHVRSTEYRYTVLAKRALSRLGGVERTYWSPRNLDTTKLFQGVFWARKVLVVFCCHLRCEGNVF